MSSPATWHRENKRPFICHEANFNYADSAKDDLRRWLEHRCLSVEGTRDELVARLRADDRDPNQTCQCAHCPRYSEVPCEEDCEAPLPRRRPSTASKEEAP